MEYDARGNIVGVVDGTQNRTQYRLDAWGWITGIIKADGSTEYYAYDLAGNMTASTDAEGLRYEMEENGDLVQFIFNLDREAVTEEDSTGLTRLIRSTELIARSTDAVRTYYHYASDEMGSTTHIVDETGEVQNRYEYDAWGNITVQEETVPNRFKFTGQQLDPITQQYYLRARFYSPVIARFTQEDTYRGDGLNLYAYCANNPVFYADPTGNEKDVLGKGKTKTTLTDEQLSQYYDERANGKTAAQAYIAATGRSNAVKPSLSWNEFQHQNKGRWSKSGLSEAWSRYKATQVIPATGQTTSQSQVRQNYNKGMQFDQYVQQTVLNQISQGIQTSGPHSGESVLRTQESFPVNKVPGRTNVRPDYAFYDQSGNRLAIGDAKATSYLCHSPQMQGFIEVAQQTASKKIVIFTPQGSGLRVSSNLSIQAKRVGVQFIILEVP